MIRKLRWIAISAVGLLSVYVFVYVLLSLFGQYRPMTESGLSHWETYPMWAPLGTFDSHPSAGSANARRDGAWSGWFFQVYSWCWRMDNRFVHTRHEVYLTGILDKHGGWIYTTNNLSPLAATK